MKERDNTLGGKGEEVMPFTQLAKQPNTPKSEQTHE